MLSRFSIPPPLELSEQTQRYQQKRRFTSAEANRTNYNNKNKRLLPCTDISHLAREVIPPLQENNVLSENIEEFEEYEHSLRTSASPSSTTLSSISGRDFSDEEEEEEELDEDNYEVVNNNNKKDTNQVDHCTLEKTQLPSHVPQHSENTSQETKNISISSNQTSNTNKNTHSSPSPSRITSSQYTNTTSNYEEPVKYIYEHKESSASPSPELPLNSSTETTQLRETTPLLPSSPLLKKKEEIEQKQKQQEEMTLPSSILLSQPLTSTIQTSRNAQREKCNTSSSLHTQERSKQEEKELYDKHEHLVSSKPTIHVEHTSPLEKVNELNQMQMHHEEEEEEERKEEHNSVKANSNNKESLPYVYNNSNNNSSTEFTSSAPVQSGLIKSSSLTPEITPFLLTHLSNDELNNIIREQGERIRTLVMERSNAQLLIAEQQRVIHTLTHNSEKFTNNLETREQECTSLRNKLKAVESECAALKDKTQLQEAEIVQFNNTWTQRSQHMKRELQALIDERNTLQVQRDEVLQNHRTLRLETEKMETQVAQIKLSTTLEKEMYKKELEEQMQSRLRDKEEILAVREDEIRREKINLEKMLRNVSDENNHLRELNETSHDDVSQLNKLLHQKETALETYKHKLTQLRTEVREKEEAMEKERNNLVQKLERILSSHQTELSHVQSQLKFSASEVEALQLQISSLQDRHQHEQNKIKQEQRLHYERNDYKEREWHNKLEEWKNKWVRAEEAHSQSISTINILQREKESISNEVQQLSLLLREARSELQQKKEHYLVAENKIELLLRKLSEKDKLIETYRIQTERELWQQIIDDNNGNINNFMKNKNSIDWKSDNKCKKQKELTIVSRDNNNEDDDNDDIEQNERFVNMNNSNDAHRIVEEEEQREMITGEYNPNKQRTSNANIQKTNNYNNINRNRNTETVLHRSREHPANREESQATNNKINSIKEDKCNSEQQQQQQELLTSRVVEEEITKCEKECIDQNKPISQHFNTTNNKLNSTTATHHKYSSLPRQSWSYSTRGISPVSIITSNSLPLQPELHSQSPWRSSLLQKGKNRVTHSLHEYNICDEPNEADNHTETLTAFREQSPLMHSYNNLVISNINGHITQGNNNSNKENEMRQRNSGRNKNDNTQIHLSCTDNGKVHYTHYNNNNSNNNNEVYFDDSVFVPSPLARLSSSTSSSEFLFTVRNKLQQLRPPFAVSSHSPSPSSPLENCSSSNNKKNKKVVHSASPLPVLHPDWHTTVNNLLQHTEEHHENNTTKGKHSEECEPEEEQKVKRNVGEEIIVDDVVVVIDEEHNNSNKIYSSGIALSSPLSLPPSLSGKREKLQVIKPIRETNLENSNRQNSSNQETNTELYSLSLIQQIIQQTMEQYHTSWREANNKSTPESEHAQYCKSVPQEAAENDLCEGYNKINSVKSNHEVSNNKTNKWNATIEEQEKVAAAADYTKEHKIIVSPRHVHHRRETAKELSTLNEEYEEEEEEQSLEPLSYLSEIPENNSNDSLKSDPCNRSNNNNNKSNNYNDMSKNTISENKTFFHDNEMIANLTWSDEVQMLASPPRTSHTFDKTRTNALNVIEAQLIDQSSIESMEDEHTEPEKTTFF